MYQTSPRTSIEECYITTIESKTFCDSQGVRVSYQQYANAVKRFGYGGISHLNAKHMEMFQTIFSSGQ